MIPMSSKKSDFMQQQKMEWAIFYNRYPIQVAQLQHPRSSRVAQLSIPGHVGPFPVFRRVEFQWLGKLFMAALSVTFCK